MPTGANERGRRVVIELHLIGYTEDAEYLVFDLDADGEGRYLLPVDPDLLATLEAVRDQRMATGLPVDERAATSHPDPRPRTRPAGEAAPRSGNRPPDGTPATEDRTARRDGDDPVSERAAGETARVGETPGGETPQDATGGQGTPRQEPAEDVTADVEAGAGSGSTVPAVSLLSPAEIQAQLRSGRSVRAVARDAGTDQAWIERWQAPILAERDRILEDAFSRRVDQPHARALGGSVERGLLDRDVDPESVRWQVARRDDGRWRITVRFEEEGRPRSATWLLDPNQPHLRPQSPLATELASPRRRDRPRRR